VRDIRADLQERLEAVGRDREELQRRISESELLETAIKALLKRETENYAALAPAPPERNFGSFAAIEAVSTFSAKDPVVSYAPKDAVGIVKPSHWGELKVG
jgi:hypothetical protein